MYTDTGQPASSDPGSCPTEDPCSAWLDTILSAVAYQSLNVCPHGHITIHTHTITHGFTHTHTFWWYTSIEYRNLSELPCRIKGISFRKQATSSLGGRGLSLL